VGINGSLEAPDGTTIGWRVLGSGETGGILVVHSGATSSADYVAVGGLLAGVGTVFLMDRRGRGLSGPQGAKYSIAQEASDIRAVIEATGADVLVGHSFGALVALQAALRLDLRALVLYEPPLSAGAQVARLAPAFARALALDDYVDAYVVLVIGLGLLGIPEDSFRWYVSTQLRPSPRWPEIVAELRAAEKELSAGAGFAPDWAAYARLPVPTLVLVGSESPYYLTGPAGRLAEVLETGRLHVLAGAGHTATNDHPALVVEAIERFLEDPSKA
jgi:pimeloyl-ACP methyl ester carboxylesterase